MPQIVQIFSNVGGDDSAYFQGWCSALRADGFTVEIVSGISTAEYRSAKTPWQRLMLRWRMYGTYAFRIIAACRRTPDAVRIVTTNPFYAPWLAALASNKRGRVIMLLFDLFPDALEVSASGRKPLFHRVLAFVTRSAFRRCDGVVFLGDRLRTHAEKRYGQAREGVVIPVGADTSVFDNRPPVPHPSGAPLSILYCGQMGFMHDTATIAEYINQGVPAGVHFHFHASGRAYADLKRECQARLNDPQIDWQGPLPGQNWKAALQEAHVGLVTLTRGAENVSMPSKTYSAMAAGQAILAIAPADSDLAQLVRETDCGWVVEPGDTAALARVVHEAQGNDDLLLRKRRNAYVSAREHYDTLVIGRQWLNLIRKMI